MDTEPALLILLVHSKVRTQLDKLSKKLLTLKTICKHLSLWSCSALSYSLLVAHFEFSKDLKEKVLALFYSSRHSTDFLQTILCV